MMAILKPRCLLPGAVPSAFNNSERVQHSCILGCWRRHVNPFADDGMLGIKVSDWVIDGAKLGLQRSSTRNGALQFRT
jgi:hypothetical protein